LGSTQSSLTFADALASAPTARPLRVDVVLTELSKADAASLLKALNDPKMPAGRIEKALGAIGVTCSGTAITKWRRTNGVVSIDARSR
jgi:hypothetical protein